MVTSDKRQPNSRSRGVVYKVLRAGGRPARGGELCRSIRSRFGSVVAGDGALARSLARSLVGATMRAPARRFGAPAATRGRRSTIPLATPRSARARAPIRYTISLPRSVSRRRRLGETGRGARHGARVGGAAGRGLRRAARGQRGRPGTSTRRATYVWLAVLVTPPICGLTPVQSQSEPQQP